MGARRRAPTECILNGKGHSCSDEQSRKQINPFIRNINRRHCHRASLGSRPQASWVLVILILIFNLIMPEFLSVQDDRGATRLNAQAKVNGNASKTGQNGVRGTFSLPLYKR